MDLFEQNKTKYNSFAELSGDDCVIAKPCKLNGKDCTYIELWGAIIELDKLLGESKNTELKMNGIVREVLVTPPEHKKLVRGTDGMAFAETFCTTASAILYQYRHWLEARDLFLRGRLGGFYDFGELSEFVYDFVVIANIKTYGDMYAILKDLVTEYTKENNCIERYFNKIISETLHIKNGGNITDYAQRIDSALNLQRNYRIFQTPYALAFILYKLTPMALIEERIRRLEEETFVQVVQK